MCNQIGKSRFVYFFTPGKKVSNLKPEFAEKGIGLDQILNFDSIPFAYEVFLGSHKNVNKFESHHPKKVTYNFGEEEKY